MITTAREGFEKRAIFRNNIAIIMETCTAYPFKYRKGTYLCFFCKNTFLEPEKLREHNHAQHSEVKHLLKPRKYEPLKMDFSTTVCKICGFQIEDYAMLKIHLTVEHGKIIDCTYGDSVLPYKLSKEEHSCQICGKTYEMFLSLHKHMNDHYEHFICETCGKGFATSQRMVNHARTHERGDFPCKKCEDPSPLQDFLKENNGKTSAQLAERTKNFTDDIKARKRQAVILLESSNICPFRWMKNLYICLYCDQQFSDPHKLRIHITVHSSLTSSQIKHTLSKLRKYELVKADVNDIRCKLCNEYIPDFPSLKWHLLDKHRKNLDPKSADGVLPFKIAYDEFQCALCIEKYAEFKSLNQHMNVHFQNFICEQCGTGFVTPERLRTHAFSHETGAFSCDSCDKVFRSTNAKNEHFATVHMKVKRHRCPQCPETFRNYFQRNKHISSIHGIKLKEFKCTMCPKVFTLSGKLGVHIRTVHLKMKRHACGVCEWKFYSQSELKEHMIRHGGERKFQCGVCKKAYARKHTLREHMRIHDNDRRFVCASCGATFVQKCSLKHHVKIHHPCLELNKLDVFTSI